MAELRRVTGGGMDKLCLVLGELLGFREVNGLCFLVPALQLSRHHNVSFPVGCASWVLLEDEQ